MVTPFAPSLKKYFGLFVLGCAAISAYFQASAAMHLVAAAITLPDIALTSTLATSKDVPGASRQVKSAKAILARNAFDSITGPLDAEPRASGGTHATLDLTDPLSAAVCTDTRALIVTESSDPKW